MKAFNVKKTKSDKVDQKEKAKNEKSEAAAASGNWGGNKVIVTGLPEGKSNLPPGAH